MAFAATGLRLGSGGSVPVSGAYDFPEFSAQMLRSERIVFVEASYKHVRCANSKLRALYIR